MNKRLQGKDAVEEMLKHGMPKATINRIFSYLPASQFTNGAYERLIDEFAAPVTGDDKQKHT